MCRTLPPLTAPGDYSRKTRSARREYQCAAVNAGVLSLWSLVLFRFSPRKYFFLEPVFECVKLFQPANALLDVFSVSNVHEEKNINSPTKTENTSRFGEPSFPELWMGLESNV